MSQTRTRGEKILDGQADQRMDRLITIRSLHRGALIKTIIEMYGSYANKWFIAYDFIKVRTLASHLK